MRLNKELVEKHQGYRKWFRKDRFDNDYYVNVDRVFEATMALFGALLLSTLIVLAAFWLYTYAVPSKAEVDLYNKRCDIVAGDTKHYVTRNSGKDESGYVCAVAPDWHQVKL